MQIDNRVVARFADGRIVKGTTQDFSVTRDFFHVIPPDPGAAPVRIGLPALKAVFFVKDHAGNKDYQEKKAFERVVPGRKLQVVFKDGETLVGFDDGLRRGAARLLHDACRPAVEQRLHLRRGARRARRGLHSVAGARTASRPV